MPLDSGIDPETVMRELRVGVNIVDLQRFREALPAAQRRAVAALLKVARIFQRAQTHASR